MGKCFLIGFLIVHLCLPACFLPPALVQSVREGEALELSCWDVTPHKLHSLYETLRLSGHLPWYTDGYQYAYTDDGLVVSFCPRNLDPALYNRTIYEDKIREILSSTLSETMSQTEIARTLHDYLLTHCTYDETLTKFTSYDAIVEGSAVCSGYAGAYMDLMNRAGVPCVMLESTSMGDSGHAWNLVSIDGHWYHVDVTWDDPLPDISGRTLHTFFLKTDEEITAQGHFGWK